MAIAASHAVSALCSASWLPGRVTVAQVEQAAAPVLGSVKSEPPVPLLVESAPEQSALALTKAVTLADQI
jgi:hypothetical protein